MQTSMEALITDNDAKDTARQMLGEGADDAAIAERTGLSVERVAELAKSTPRPALLANHVDVRLRELGLSYLAASNIGTVSRSTLTTLAERIPTRQTLTKLDELLSWEDGSAQAALYGQEPTPRERKLGPRRPIYDPNAPDDYANLMRWIESRLHELNMNKVRFADISGVGRSTLATLGKRGYNPAPQTLDRIDTHLMWVPGSALAALKGSVPVRRGPAPAPHPGLIPLTAVKEAIKRLSARLSRQRASLDQAERELQDMMRHVGLVISDLGNTTWTPESEEPGEDDHIAEDESDRD